MRAIMVAVTFRSIHLSAITVIVVEAVGIGLMFVVAAFVIVKGGLASPRHPGGSTRWVATGWEERPATFRSDAPVVPFVLTSLLAGIAILAVLVFPGLRARLRAAERVDRDKMLTIDANGVGS